METPSNQLKSQIANTQLIPSDDEISAIRHRIPQIRFNFAHNQFIVIKRKHFLDEKATFGFETPCLSDFSSDFSSSKPIENAKHNVYPFTIIISNQKISDLLSNLNDYFTSYCWLQLEIPGFGFNGALLTNRPFEGLLYILMNNWGKNCLFKWCSITDEMVNKLEPILGRFGILKNAKNETEIKTAINEICDFIEQLDNRTFFDVQFTLFEIQLQIYHYVQQTVKSGHILPREISFKNFNKIYFKIPGTDLNYQVLCMNISKESYPGIAEFSNFKNLRIVQFVYPTDMKEYMEYGNNLDFDERARILHDHKHQKPQIESLFKKFNNKIVTPDQLIWMKGELQNKQIEWTKENRKLFRVFFNSMVVKLQMPPQFGYTCVAISRKIRAGVLHSIARHSDQWVGHIRGFERAMDKLSAVRAQLDGIRAAGELGTDAMEAAYEEYRLAHKRNRKNVNHKIALMFAQLQVLERIQDILSHEPYMGEAINEEGKIAALFKVYNLTGEPYYLYLGVSSNLYPPIPQFADPRPVRLLTTAFFRSWELYSKLDVITGKAWQLEWFSGLPIGRTDPHIPTTTKIASTSG